ncbi:hypothetical protein SSX86_011150 [Deinandra increscens subsp. villosa]|uniref:RRM domain-containing protein n=1 Tax=Deinandra increscens subsp. villosa TaxID=3103831 RepID=A0AAP0DGM5_9ASTR
MSRSRSFRPFSRTRSRGRERRYHRDERDRYGREGLGRGDSRVRVGSDDGYYGYEQRGPVTRFYNTDSEKFPHGQFDNYGILREYEYMGEEHANPNDWKTVSYRKNRYRSKTPVRRYVSREKTADRRWDESDKWSTSVFVTNFPAATTKKGLYDRCSGERKVLDVFLSEKPSTMGKRYAFVRFSKGVDISNAIYKIRNMWIGSFRLFADITRFKRGDDKGEEEDKRKQPVDKNKGKMDADKGQSGTEIPKKHVYWASVPDVGGSSNGTGDKARDKAVSEAEHVKNVGSDSSETQVGGVERNKEGDEEIVSEKYVISKAKQVPLENFQSALLLKLRDVKSMAKIYHIARSEGFENVSFRYIGGWWIRVDCNSKDESAKFANCKAFKSVFSAVRRVSSDFLVKENMVWIGIYGLPLGAWSSDVFSGIASKWGKVCFIDNDYEEPLACGKVCILTSNVKRIEEEIICDMGGTQYKVTVSQHQYWTPSFDTPCESDESSSEDEESVADGENLIVEQDVELDKVYEQVNKSKKQDVVVANEPEEEAEVGNVEKDNSDPFGIMEFLTNQFPDLNKNYSVSLSVPPGFERKVEDNNDVVNMRNEESVETPVCEFVSTKAGEPKIGEYISHDIPNVDDIGYVDCDDGGSDRGSTVHVGFGIKKFGGFQSSSKYVFARSVRKLY